MGDLFHPPGYQPYVTCAVCSLYEGMEDPVHVETALAAFPRPDPMHKGRELSPYPYQADDSRLIASVRSILVNAQQGTGKCCSPSTLWNISGGLLEAESVWSQFMSKERFDGEGYWSDPSAPLFVNAINESTGRIERAKVTQLYRQKVKERVRRVKLKDGSQLEITKAHKLYAVDHWTNDYQAGDLVCVPVKLPHESGAFDAELAELFGWVIGDGHEYTKVGALAGVLTQKDRSVLDHCKGLLEKQLMRAGVSDRVIQIRDHDGTGRASDLYFRGKGIRAFFKSHDYPWATLSKDRRVPKPIMQAGPESVRAFLRAYFDAEGSAVEKSRIVEVSSASRRLIQEVSHLLRRFGIWLRVRKKRARATNSRTPTWRDYWIGTIGGTSVRTYRDEIGFGVAEKQGKLERICAKKINPNMEGVPGAQIILDLIQETGLTPSQLGVGVNGMSSAYLRGESRFTRKTLGVVIRSMDAILDRGPDVVRRKYEKATAIMTLKNLDRVAFKAARDQLQKLIDQEVHYVTVESVEEFDYEGWVYDLTVEGHENYVAEGVLTHNTPTLLLSLDPSMGHMITCPAGLTGNWEREGARWRPDLEFEVCRSKGFWDLPSPGKVLIFSYGLLPGDPCKACKKKRKRACLHRDDQLNPLPEIDRPFTLSIDEIQFIQNKTVRRRKWDLLKNAVWEAGGYLRGLTGTSVSNKPGDLKEILQSLNLDRAALGGEGGVDAIHREIWSDWYDNDKGSRSVPVGREKEALLQRLRPRADHSVAATRPQAPATGPVPRADPGPAHPADLARGRRGRAAALGHAARLGGREVRGDSVPVGALEERAEEAAQAVGRREGPAQRPVRQPRRHVLHHPPVGHRRRAARRRQGGARDQERLADDRRAQ